MVEDENEAFSGGELENKRLNLTPRKRPGPGKGEHYAILKSEASKVIDWPAAMIVLA